MPDVKYACLHGHQVEAQDRFGASVDLEGYLCPVCLGAIVGAGDMIDSRILAPVQEKG